MNNYKMDKKGFIIYKIQLKKKFFLHFYGRLAYSRNFLNLIIKI
jgi:hypothetical protein